MFKIVKEINDRVGEGCVNGNLGISYYDWGYFEEVIKYYELECKIIEEVNDRVGEGCVVGNFGVVYCCFGYFKKFIKFYKLEFCIV